MDLYYYNVPAAIPIILEVLLIVLPAMGLYLTCFWPRTPVPPSPRVIIGKILKLEAAGGGEARGGGGGGGGVEPVRDQCSICLQEFKGGDEYVVLTVCRHFYHKRCIDEWLSKHSICPLCRASVCPSTSTATTATPAAAASTHRTNIRLASSVAS